MPLKKNRRKNPLRKRGRRRHGKRHPTMDRIQTLRVRAPGVVCPDRTMVKLKYLDITNQIVGSIGSNVGALQYVANDAHTLAPVGFTEMAALYRYYRVRGTAIRVMGTNMETFPVLAFVTPINTSYSITLAHGQQLYQNAFTRSKVLAPKGGQDRFFIKSFISTRKIVGTKAVQFDDSYAALTTSTPNNVWYYYVYVMPVDSLDTFTAANQVRVTVQLTLYVEFYERNILAS